MQECAASEVIKRERNDRRKVGDPKGSPFALPKCYSNKNRIVV